MSDNPLALLGTGMAVPAAFHPLMESQQASALQANVGQSFAVVSIKGKQWAIKFGGQTTQLTVNFNGQTVPAPWFDVVLVAAKSELSKTWYKDGYADGADESPTCWSEDGITPLAPLQQRPLDDRTGQPCTDCRMCPLNVFGSKITEAGKQVKACADTRKLLLAPLAPTGQINAHGFDPGVVDTVNAKFGGGMMLRVPAATLKPLAEYDQKLQAAGIPFYAVVTRMQFDSTQAYPKIDFKALRVVTDAEAAAIIEMQNGMQAKQILESSQVGATAARTEDPGVRAADVPAAMQPAAGTPQAPRPTSPATVVPIRPAAPAQPAPVPAPAAPTAPPPAAPPAATVVPPAPQMTAAATNTYDEYKAAGWSDDQLVQHGLMLPLAPAMTPPGPGAPPSAGVVVNEALLSTVDSLLGR